MGYLGTEDNTAYLSQGHPHRHSGYAGRQQQSALPTILFKCAVELNMLCHTIAAHFRTDPDPHAGAAGLRGG